MKELETSDSQACSPWHVPCLVQFSSSLCSLAEQEAGELFRVCAALQGFEQSGNCGIWSACGESGVHLPGRQQHPDVHIPASLWNRRHHPCAGRAPTSAKHQDPSAERGWGNVRSGSDQVLSVYTCHTPGSVIWRDFLFWESAGE